MKPTLAALEQWLQAVVLHPDGVRAASNDPNVRRELEPDGASLEEIILPSKALPSEQRLAIYSNMIRLRFEEVLAADFLALQALVGAAAFRRLGRDYLEQRPSRSITLNRLGEGLADWLSLHPDPPAGAVDVARLEWSVQEVFQEAEDALLGVEALHGLAPEQLASHPFPLIRAARLLRLERPVLEFCLSIERNIEPPPLLPSPEESLLLVHRRADGRVHRRALTGPQFELLTALQRNAKLEDALEGTIEVHPDPDWIPHLSAWFQDWAQEGLFASAERPSP